MRHLEYPAIYKRSRIQSRMTPLRPMFVKIIYIYIYIYTKTRIGFRGPPYLLRTPLPRPSRTISGSTQIEERLVQITKNDRYVKYAMLKGPKSGTLTCLTCFRLAGSASGAGVGPLLAASLLRTERKPVPNCPGRKPGQIGTGVRHVRTRLAAKIAPKPAPEAQFRDRKHYCADQPTIRPVIEASPLSPRPAPLPLAILLFATLCRLWCRQVGWDIIVHCAGKPRGQSANLIAIEPRRPSLSRFAAGEASRNQFET